MTVRTGARPASRTVTSVLAIDGDQVSRRSDHLATEEPLEVRVTSGDRTATVAVTMRTPGADFELAAGFLAAEGVLTDRRGLAGLAYCADDVQNYNIVTAQLRGPLPDLRGLERHVMTSSACGVCGKASLEALELRGCSPPASGPVVDAALLARLPDTLRAAQRLFASTGGLHAAGLFTATGELVCLREDVGRHNAVDKLVGWALLEDRLPLSDHLLLVSGRSSWEIVSKALVAGIPFVASVSAPSSLAVDLAREFGMTLVGFLRDQRCNVYTGADRIRLPLAAP